MNNAERIAQWRRESRRKLTPVNVTQMLDMLEQQQAQIEEATKRGDEILKELCETQAKLASVALTGSPYHQEALAQRELTKYNEGIDAAIEELQRCQQVALHKNHDIADADLIVALLDMLEQLKNGGEL